MKKSLLIIGMTVNLVFLFTSCSTISSPNHTMDDGNSMSGTTHEDSTEQKVLNQTGTTAVDEETVV
jgi:hypothetical protein